MLCIKVDSHSCVDHLSDFTQKTCMYTYYTDTRLIRHWSHYIYSRHITYRILFNERIIAFKASYQTLIKSWRHLNSIVRSY